MHVLVGIAVKRHEVRRHCGDLVGIRSLVGCAKVQLPLHQQVLLGDRREIWRVNNHSTEHAVGDVHRHRHCRTVVHPNARLGRSEGVRQTLARLNRAHWSIGRQGARVEVDRVADRAVVDEGYLERVANTPA